MPKPTKPLLTPIIYVRTPIPEHYLSELLKQTAAHHAVNPKSVEVQIGLDQLSFLKECIVEATKSNPNLGQYLDEWEDPMGETLIDLINMTITEPGEFGILHGWVV
jgi:hypothetical protein